MYLSCRKLCVFVVWTTKDVAVMKIERDDSWSTNMPRLIKFYSERRMVSYFIFNLPCDCI